MISSPFMARGVSGITCYRQLDCLACPAEMNSPVFDTAAEDVLRELLTAPSQEDTQSDWEAAAAEAVEMVAPLPAAAGPEPAQNNASVDLPGPTQTPKKTWPISFEAHWLCAAPPSTQAAEPPINRGEAHSCDS